MTPMLSMSASGLRRSGAFVIGMTIAAVGLIRSAPVVGPLASPQTVDDLVRVTAWWSATALAGWLVLSIVVLAPVIARPSSPWSPRLARVTIPGSRRLAQALFAVAVLGTPPGCTATTSEVAPPRLEVLGTVVPSTTTAPASTIRTPASTDSTSNDVRSPASHEAHSDDAERAATGELAEPPEADAADGTEPAVDLTHVVVRGEHLWSIAEQRLADVLGRPASVADVTDYWVELVRANRASLRSGDPDLIHPGEVLVLPPPDLVAE